MTATALPTNWADDTGQKANAAFLNALGLAVNSLNQAGTYANRPAAGVFPGIEYRCTDNGNVYRDNGTSWDLISVAGSGLAGTEPPSTGWTNASAMGSAVIAADKGARLLTVPSASGDNWRYERRNLSSSSNFTVTGYIETSTVAPATDTLHTGLILSDGTKFYSFGQVSLNSTVSPFTTGWNLAVRKWTNATTWSTEGANLVPAKLLCRPNWMRIRDDGTNLNFEYSINGIDWNAVFSEAHTTFLTATVYGWGADNGTGANAAVRLRSLSLA